MLAPACVSVIITVGASNVGMGAPCGDEANYWEYPSWFIEFGYHINFLESLNLLFALLGFHPNIRNKNVLIYTDQ